MATLQILLQARFRIFLFIARTYLIQTGFIPVKDQLLDGLDIAIEEILRRLTLQRCPPGWTPDEIRRFLIRTALNAGISTNQTHGLNSASVLPHVPTWRAYGSRLSLISTRGETVIKRVSDNEAQD